MRCPPLLEHVATRWARLSARSCSGRSIGRAACARSAASRSGSIRTCAALAVVATLPAWAAETPTPLAGTRWELVELTPSGALPMRPLDPARYQIEFLAEGAAALRLDCNRGRARWEADSLAPGEGTIGFGPIAATRAQCAPDSIGEPLGRALAEARHWRIEPGGGLTLELARGGALAWRPAR